MGLQKGGNGPGGGRNMLGCLLFDGRTARPSRAMADGRIAPSIDVVTMIYTAYVQDL